MLPSLHREGPRPGSWSVITPARTRLFWTSYTPLPEPPSQVIMKWWFHPHLTRDRALGQPPPQTGVRTERCPPDDRHLLALHLRSQGVAVTQADSGLLCARPSANLDILLNPLKQRPVAIPPGKATWRPRAPDSAWPAGTAHTCGARSFGDSPQLGKQRSGRDVAFVLVPPRTPRICGQLTTRL